MAYRLIYSEFWKDPKVMEEMTPEDRYFYLFLLTNPSTTNCGIYLITKKQMAFELGYSTEVINALMDRFEKQYKLIAYNTETRELAIKNWGKYNLSRGGKPVLDCLSSELKKIKDKSLIKYILQNINNETLRELYESFYDTFTSGEREVAPQGDNTDTDTSTNTSANTDTDTERDTYRATGTSTSTYAVTKLDGSTNINGNSDELISVGANKDEIINIASSSENLDVQTLSLSLIQEYEKLTGKIGVLKLTAVKIALSDHGYSNVKKAINKALEKGKLSMSYVNGILRTWEREGYPKEEEYYDNGSSCKTHGTSTSEFAGFKPQQPRALSEEERRELEGELL